MRSYLVTVHSNMVKVEDYKPRVNQSPDLLAHVDGDRFQYFIRKHRHLAGKYRWRDRGSTQAFYHAKNSGTIVQWIPSGRKLRTHKKEQSAKQLELF